MHLYCMNTCVFRKEGSGPREYSVSVIGYFLHSTCLLCTSNAVSYLCICKYWGFTYKLKFKTSFKANRQLNMVRVNI